MRKLCICGNEFNTIPSRLKEKRGKFCSKKCQYENATRPNGLKYVIKVVNKGWVKKGDKPINGFKQGIIPWNKNKKGIHLSKQTEFKKGQMTGKNNVNWKGGITPKNMKIRHSLEYKDWRTKVFQRDNYTCQECGNRGVTLHADHIKPFAYFSELRLIIDNGRTLCVPCHRKTPTYARGAKKIYEQKT